MHKSYLNEILYIIFVISNEIKLNNLHLLLEIASSYMKYMADQIFPHVGMYHNQTLI